MTQGLQFSLLMSGLDASSATDSAVFVPEQRDAAYGEQAVVFRQMLASEQQSKATGRGQTVAASPPTKLKEGMTKPLDEGSSAVTRSVTTTTSASASTSELAKAGETAASAGLVDSAQFVDSTEHVDLTEAGEATENLADQWLGLIRQSGDATNLLRQKAELFSAATHTGFLTEKTQQNRDLDLVLAETNNLGEEMAEIALTHDNQAQQNLSKQLKSDDRVYGLNEDKASTLKESAQRLGLADAPIKQPDIIDQKTATQRGAFRQLDFLTSPPKIIDSEQINEPETLRVSKQVYTLTKDFDTTEKKTAAQDGTSEQVTTPLTKTANTMSGIEGTVDLTKQEAGREPKLSVSPTGLQQHDGDTDIKATSAILEQSAMVKTTAGQTSVPVTSQTGHEVPTVAKTAIQAETTSDSANTVVNDVEALFAESIATKAPQPTAAKESSLLAHSITQDDTKTQNKVAAERQEQLSAAAHDNAAPEAGTANPQQGVSLGAATNANNSTIKAAAVEATSTGNESTKLGTIKVSADTTEKEPQSEQQHQQRQDNRQFNFNRLEVTLQQNNAVSSTLQQSAALDSAAETNNALLRTEQFSQVLEQQNRAQQVAAPAPSLAAQLKQLNLQQQDAAGQLRERVQLMVRQNIQFAEIRLDPAELGQMQIRINLQQEQATVQFIVQQQHAKELLEQQMPRLRELLQQQGMQLGEGQVQQQAKEDRQSAGQQAEQGRRQSTQVSEQDEATQTLTVQLKHNDRLVDYYA